MARSPTTPRMYGRPLGQRFIRRVWAAVTAAPCATTREIASALGQRGYGNVGAALRYLVQAGYIEFDGPRARRVLVPLYTQTSPHQRHHTPARAGQETTTMASSSIADAARATVRSSIGNVHVLGFATPTPTIRVEGDVRALAAVGHAQLARAVDLTLAVLLADQRARRGDPVPAYHVGPNIED